MMQRSEDWVETTWRRRWWYRAAMAAIVVALAIRAAGMGDWSCVPIALICAGLIWLYPIIMVDARGVGRRQSLGHETHLPRGPLEIGFMLVPEHCPLCGRGLSTKCPAHGAVTEP